MLKFEKNKIEKRIARGFKKNKSTYTVFFGSLPRLKLKQIITGSFSKYIYHTFYKRVTK